MRYTVRLENVVKWTFLMAWSNVFLTGMKSVVWYHLSSSGLLLTSRSLSAIFPFWVGGWLVLLVRLTYHMPDVFDRLPF